MAVIPLKQDIEITKADGLDDWGDPIPGEVIAYKARVSETTKIVTNRSGKEAVASLHIYLDKLADITYDDTITYVDEIGVTVTRMPLKIGIKRNFGGRAILTEVYV